MKPTPHPHRCPECPCVWNCANEHCLDLEGKWCGDVCATCAKMPAYLEKLGQVQDARERIRYAAHLLREAGEVDLAESGEYLARLTQTRAEERAKGTPVDPDQDLMSDSADLHAGEI